MLHSIGDATVGTFPALHDKEHTAPQTYSVNLVASFSYPFNTIYLSAPLNIM